MRIRFLAHLIVHSQQTSSKHAANASPPRINSYQPRPPHPLPPSTIGSASIAKTTEAIPRHYEQLTIALGERRRPLPRTAGTISPLFPAEATGGAERQLSAHRSVAASGTESRSLSLASNLLIGSEYLRLCILRFLLAILWRGIFDLKGLMRCNL